MPKKASNPPRVLVTNAEERSMLAVCRSLHTAGYEVTATSSTALATAKWSRSCSRRLHVANPRKDADMFVEHLRRELARHSYATLICGGDSALFAVSQARDALQPLTDLGLPPRAVVTRALSRESLAQTAEQAGLASTLSIRCVDLEQALAAADELGFPVVLKSPEAASAEDRAAPGSPKSRIVATNADLAKAAPAFGEGLLVQRWMPGDLISVGGVIAGGRILAAVVARYERMWPPEGGSVSFGEAITPPPGLEDSVQRLLNAIEWEGIFELEVIQARSGGFAPIDFNPRPYGSLAAATSAGVPLAAIWCDWLLGRDPQPAYARAGCRYRWEDADLRHLAWQMRRGNYRAAAATMLPHRRVTHAHFQLSDPLPLLARWLYLGKRLWEDKRTQTR
jgi:predicted ATP-grasp superfamily ATP-dependent carboligase